MSTIKCGRKIYDLRNGDTVIDNGACYQLITRKERKGYNEYTLEISKSEFKKFISMDNVKENDNHRYGDNVTLYTFIID